MSDLWTPASSQRQNAVIVSPQSFRSLTDLARWCNELGIHQQHDAVYKVERILSVQVIHNQASASYEAVLLCEVLI